VPFVRISVLHNVSKTLVLREIIHGYFVYKNTWPIEQTFKIAFYINYILLEIETPLGKMAATKQF